MNKSMIEGRIPPQCLEIEQVVLGAMLLEKEVVDKVIKILTGDENCFYKPAHQVIFRGIVNLHEKNIPVDLISLSQQLRQIRELEKAGGEYYLTELTTKISSAANCEYHAHIILEKAINRQLITSSTETINKAYDESTDTLELLDEVSLQVAKITELSKPNAQYHPVSLSIVTNELCEKIDKIYSGEDDVLKFGFTDIDNVTCGMEKGDLIIIAGLEKRGKCFGKDTPILMFDGSVKMVQDIKANDIIMGDDSKPRKVLNTNQGRDEMFKITLSRRAGRYICNKEHVLVLKRNSYAKTVKRGMRRNGEIIEISVGEYLKRETKGYREHYRQFKASVEFPEKSLLIDPYCLGLWLGDGTSRCSNITSADESIINWLREYSYSQGYKFKKYKTRSKAVTISMGLKRGSKNSLQAKLRDLGLIGNKHIPEDYLINSRLNRLKLLAGLIDTDGYAADGHRVNFLNKNKLLCNQIIFLARSLGFHCGDCRIKHNKKYNTDYYEISISGDIQAIPVLLKRKILPPSNKPKDCSRYTCKIKSIGTGDYYGFTIDGNGRFLLADFTVSHNSVMLLQSLFYNALQGIPCLLFSTEMKRTMLLLRYVFIKEKVSWIKFRKREMSISEIEKLKMKVQQYKNVPLYVSDCMINANELSNEADKFIKDKGVRLIGVDYLQRIQSVMKKQNENREREVAMVANCMKNIAFKNNISIIALSQYNDALRARESRVIEQEMDKLIGIGAEEKDILTVNGSGNIVEIKIRQRFGASGNFGDVKMIYDKGYGYWKSYINEDKYDEPQQEEAF